MKFMNEYKREWYGNNAKIINKNLDYMTIDYGCPGKGIITCYNLFPGIQMSFQDVETNIVFPSNTFDTDIISVNYCITGRQESEFKDHTVSYLPEHHLSVNGTQFLPVSFSFPLQRYVGVSLVIEKKSLDKKTKDILEIFRIDINEIEEKLNLDNKWFIAHPTDKMIHLFNGIENNEKNIDFLRIKALEVLHLISEMNALSDDEHSYFSKKQIESTKLICQNMISNLDSKMTIEQYAEEYEISLSMFHKIFFQIYGATPYAYLKKYKMNIAAGKLRDGKQKICDIALEVGYNNPSKFSRAFKAIYGLRPKEYQLKYKK